MKKAILILLIWNTAFAQNKVKVYIPEEDMTYNVDTATFVANSVSRLDTTFNVDTLGNFVVRKIDVKITFPNKAVTMKFIAAADLITAKLIIRMSAEDAERARRLRKLNKQ